VESPGGREDTHEGDVPKETHDASPSEKSETGSEASQPGAQEPGEVAEPAEVVPDEVVAAEPEVEAAPEPPPRRRGFKWLWIAAVLIAAAVVGSVIGVNLGGRQAGPLANQTAGSGRPTIIVATVAAAPSVPAVPSPSVIDAGSPVVTGATVATPQSTTYTVKPGDTLRSIAEEEYGDAGLWPKIYQANRDTIGPDPDNLVAGTTLTLPPP
jgi:nucleoid-associated protein YgaU